ncbi:MAG: dTMP kinase, partial [Geodermatophilaceae bacterium]|nr:dTMP kinase [Geodermatophilaceae bacterium]
LGSERIPIVAALGLNALSFFAAAATVYASRHEIPSFLAGGGDTTHVFAAIREGVVFIRRSAVLRGLYVGILGAFLAGGVVVGVAQLYVVTLNAGTAGYSILFGTVFTGLAIGMVVGPRILPTISRRRLFGLAISASGVTMVAMSLLADFVLVVTLALLVGIFGGVAWINGYTMIGYEVEDRLRGRVFAFVMSSVRVTLLVAVAVGPLFAGWVGNHSARFRGVELRFTGPGVTLLLAGLLAGGVGLYASRQLGGGARRLLDLLWATVSRPDLLGQGRLESGLLVVIDGNGTDALIAAQAERLTAGLRTDGYPVVLTGEPEQTVAGGRIATLVAASEQLAPETEALLLLAERAEHVARVVRPALIAREVVVCRRYTDSSLAYLGSHLGLDRGRLRRTSQWATGDLVPELTVVLDGPAAPGRDGVRRVFLELADADPVRYVLLPADLDPDVMAETIRDRVAALLATRSERVARTLPASDAPGPVAAAG